jgi:hypothetical protein
VRRIALLLAAVLPALGAAAPADAAGARAVGEREALVVLTSSGARASRISRAQARADVFTGPRSPAAFLRESSGGRLALVGRDRRDGDVIGPYDVGPLDPCTEAGRDRLERRANTAARRAGRSLDGYDHVLYVTWPHPGCGTVNGAGQLPPGRRLVLYDNLPDARLRPRTLAHELGHNLGLRHAGLLRCTDGPGGPKAAISATCEAPDGDQGDRLELMGAAGDELGRLLSAPRRDALGWTVPGEVRAAVASGTYELCPLMAPGGTRALTITRPGDARRLWLELRRPHGTFDDFAPGDPAIDALQVRLAGPDGRSQLVDARPETATWADAPLPAGRTLRDPVTGIAITLQAVDPASGRGAVVLGLPGTPDVGTVSTSCAAPPAPPVSPPAVVVLDTRRGVGAPRRALRARRTVRVRVGGRGGLPRRLRRATVELSVRPPGRSGAVRAWNCAARTSTARRIAVRRGRASVRRVAVRLSRSGVLCLRPTTRLHVRATVVR